MTHEESLQQCKALFLQEKTAGRVFYAVNKPYLGYLRLPTVDELVHGIETQEATNSRVKPTHIIIVRLDASGNPVLLETADGRKVIDQWASGREKVRENFDYAEEPQDGCPVLAKRKPGKPCAYIRLSQPLETVHERGSETWPDGYMSCWNEETMDDFTAVSPTSFAEMKEPADELSASIFKRLQAEPSV